MELLVRISCPAREPTKKLGEGADFSFPQFSGSDSGIGDPLISCSEDCSTKRWCKWWKISGWRHLGTVSQQTWRNYSSKKDLQAMIEEYRAALLLKGFLKPYKKTPCPCEDECGSFRAHGC